MPLPDLRISTVSIAGIMCFDVAFHSFRAVNRDILTVTCSEKDISDEQSPVTEIDGGAYEKG